MLQLQHGLIQFQYHLLDEGYGPYSISSNPSCTGQSGQVSKSISTIIKVRKAFPAWMTLPWFDSLDLQWGLIYVLSSALVLAPLVLATLETVSLDVGVILFFINLEDWPSLPLVADTYVAFPEMSFSGKQPWSKVMALSNWLASYLTRFKQHWQFTTVLWQSQNSFDDTRWWLKPQHSSNSLTTLST